MRARHRHFNPRFAGAGIALDSRYGFSQSDGTAVSTWTSRTGSNNATQSTATNQPTYETNEQGGQPTVRFDGANDFLNYTTSVFSYTGGATVIGVVKVTSKANAYGSVISEFGGINSSIGCQPNVFPNNSIEIATDIYAPGGMRYNSTLSNSTWYIMCWSWSNWSTHKTNGDTILAYNGTEVGGTAYGSNPLSFSSIQKTIAAFLDVVANPQNCITADISLVESLPQCSAALRRKLYHAAAYSFKIACS